MKLKSLKKKDLKEIPVKRTNEMECGYEIIRHPPLLSPSPKEMDLLLLMLTAIT